MSKAVSVDNFADELVSQIKQYTDDVSKAIEEETERTANDILKQVKSLAPKRTGEYAKGFTKTKAKLKSGVNYTVWNKKHYRRVHLLELGHAKRGGGRVQGQPHMRPALENNINAYEKRIEKIIKEGG